QVELANHPFNRSGTSPRFAFNGLTSFAELICWTIAGLRGMRNRRRVEHCDWRYFRFARDTLTIGFSNRLNCIGQPLSLSHDQQVLSTYPLKDRSMMKALIRDRYGPPDVLEVRDIEPPAPKEREVLVRVHAASINDWDWQMLQRPMVPLGFNTPRVRILGSDIAGRVAAVGSAVQRFTVG